MFGTFRFVLALLVVVTHLDQSIWWSGPYAVFGFYLISGYLMCLVLNQRYGFAAAGLGAYAVNRFLRIYPPYWFACGISAAIVGLLGQPAATQLFGPWQLPAATMDWIDNLGIVTLPTGNANRLIPPSWALRVELFYYAVIGLGLGRTRKLAVVWVAVSIGYHVYLAYTGAGWTQKYYPIAAASLPFSLGALLYHSRAALVANIRVSTAMLALVLAIWATNLVLDPMAFGGVLGSFRYYLNLACVTAVAASLCALEVRRRSLLRIDARLGDLAYPIYLTHMPVGLAVAATGIGPSSPNSQLLFASLLPILFVSWLTLRLVSDPIENLRSNVKARLEPERPA
ncbi:MAG: acyltransferase [bacterium]|nr:acyltransferase [bacterium]